MPDSDSLFVARAALKRAARLAEQAELQRDQLRALVHKLERSETGREPTVRRLEPFRRESVVR